MDALDASKKSKKKKSGEKVRLMGSDMCACYIQDRVLMTVIQ